MSKYKYQVTVGGKTYLTTTLAEAKALQAKRNPTPAYHRSRGEAEYLLAEDSYRKAQALRRRGDASGSHDALIHAHRMAALAEADLLDGASPKAADAKRLAWWKAYSGLAADKRRNPKRNPSLLTLAALGGVGYALLHKPATKPQTTRERAIRHFGQKPPTPTRDMMAENRRYLVWAYDDETGWYESVTRRSYQSAMATGVWQASYENDPKFAVQEYRDGRWMPASVVERPAGGWRPKGDPDKLRNPRKVRNPYLHKFIPPGGKGYQYVYSEEDVAKRHAKKAQRIEQLKAKEDALKRGVKRDVAAGDPTALAVGLILTTYERPGNPGSAKAGHYGVTGWQCRHLTASGRKAAIDYIGKSGVHQTKEITEPYLVRALSQRQRECKRKGGQLIPTNASAVNRYLDSYDISAKDLRTFGANTEMQKELSRVRAAGPALSTLKTRDVKKALKAEFNAALAVVAGKLGHTTSVLRKQYLVQGIEPLYLESGRVLTTFV